MKPWRGRWTPCPDHVRRPPTAWRPPTPWRPSLRPPELRPLLTTVSLREWWQRPHRDLLSGLVVAFAMIPEAIAFSGIAGVAP